MLDQNSHPDPSPEQAVLEGLRILAGGFGVTAGIFALINYARLPNSVGASIALFNGILCFALLGLWLATSRRRIAPRWASPLVAVVLTATALNALLSYILRAEPLQSHLISLLVVAAGFFLLSTPWLLITVGCMIAAWAPVAGTISSSPEERLQLVLNMAGAVVLATVIHLTRRRTQQRLGQAVDEARSWGESYRRLFRQSQDAVALSTPAGRLIDINQAGLDLFGLTSKEELAEIDIARDLFVDARQREKLKKQLLADGFVKDFSFDLKTRQGKKLNCEGTSSAIRDDTGEIVSFLAILRDVTLRRQYEADLASQQERLENLVEERTASLEEAVTILKNEIRERQRAEEERRQLEAQFQQTQKLESLGVLTGGIAHDFNNLLVGILGNAGLALKSITDTTVARPHIELVEIAARRAADLTHQMLAYSGKEQPDLEACDLDDLVREMSSLLDTSISKKVDLEIRSEAGLPAVRADATQIRQVVLNLITNASEAIGAGRGKVRVDLETTTIEPDSFREIPFQDALVAGSYVCLTVSDSGCGMDAITRQKVFDPFFTTKVTGRGLGLAAVLGIVRSHRGAISVDSDPGRGSTFRILLPACEECPQPAAAPVLSESDWQGEGTTILVVDDEEVVRNVARATLEMAGFNVMIAADGQQALDLIDSGEAAVADAILLDMNMPNLDGAQVFRELRRRRHGAAVVLTSGDHREDTALPFVDDTPPGFLTKPYSPDELLQKIQDALGARIGREDPVRVG